VLEAAAIPVRSQSHFDVGDGWQVIMSGEDVRRAKSLQRVAITRAEIAFDSEEDLKKSLEIIKDSDARLSKVPDSEVMYDWQIVRRKGLTVRFGVAWYDQDFFQKRKDAYQSSVHQGIFKQFGVPSQSIRFEHVPLAPN
jgi:hypothetical protein